MLNTGDKAFMIICTAVVFIMTPGLALFYGGLGHSKNMVNNMMNSVFIMGLGIVFIYVDRLFFVVWRWRLKFYRVS